MKTPDGEGNGEIDEDGFTNYATILESISDKKMVGEKKEDMLDGPKDWIGLAKNIGYLLAELRKKERILLIALF